MRVLPFGQSRPQRAFFRFHSLAEG
jgi:hypothetical protein